MRKTTIALLIAGALIAVGCASGPNANETPTAPLVTTTVPDPGVRPSADLGAGTPGAFCATSRLGKTFTLDGVTYVCAAPKPYKWRRQ